MWRGDDEQGKLSLPNYAYPTLGCQACRLRHSQILSESMVLVFRLKLPSHFCSLSSIARGHNHSKGVEKLIKHDSRWAHFNIDQGHGLWGLNITIRKMGWITAAPLLSLQSENTLASWTHQTCWKTHTQAIHHNLAAVLDIKGQCRPLLHHPKQKELHSRHRHRSLALSLSLSVYDCRRTLFSGNLSQIKGKVRETELLLNVV